MCRSDENDPERTSAGSKSRAAAILAAFKRAVAQGKRLGRPQIDGGIERKAQRVAARCARAAADDADGRVFSFRSSGEIASVEAALRQGLSEAGYVEHRNVAIGAGGDADTTTSSNAQHDQLNQSDADEQHCKRHHIVFEPMPIIAKHHVHPYANAL